MLQIHANPYPLEGPRRAALEAAIVLLAVATAAVLITEPLFAIYILPAVLVVLAFLSFDSFVYAMVFLLPWYPLPAIDLPVRDAFMILRLVMCLGVGIVRFRSGRSMYEWLLGGKLKKLVVAYAAVAAISLFFSPFPLKLDAFRGFARFLSYLALFFAIVGWVQTREQISRLIRLLLISGIIVALFGFLQELVGGYTDFYLYLFESEIPDWNGRISSFLFHFNALAAYLNMIIPFAVAWMVTARHRSTKGLGWISFSLASAAVYLTGSRGGLLAFAAVLLWCVAVIYLRYRPGFEKVKKGGLALALAGLIVVALVPKPSEQEQTTRLQEVDDFTELSRLALWGTAAEMFIEHPILGVGYGNYKALYVDYLPDIEADKMDAHNLYLQLLAETGIVGFALFFMPVLILLWRSFILVRDPDLFFSVIGFGVGGALISTLVHGTVDYFFHVQTQVGGLFWLVMAIGLAVSEEQLRFRKASFNPDKSSEELRP